MLNALVFSYLSLNKFVVPKSIKNDIESWTKTSYGINLDLNDLVIDLPSNKINIDGFAVSLPENKSFISVGSTSIDLSSNTALIDLISNNTVVNKITVSDLVYDLTAPQVNDSSESFKLPYIPSREIVLDGFSIITDYGTFDLSNNTAIIKKEDGILNVEFLMPNGPFGLCSNISALLNLETRIASLGVILEHKSLVECIPLTLLASEKNVNLTSGSLFVDLKYNGNVESRINKPLENLEDLLNNDLYGQIKILDLNLSWNGLNANVNISANRAPNEKWKYEIDGYLNKGKINLSGIWNCNNSNFSCFDTKLTFSKLKLPTEIFDYVGLPKFDYSIGYISGSGNILGDVNNFIASSSLTFSDWTILGKSFKKTDVLLALNDDKSINVETNIDSSLGKMNASTTLWLDGDNKNKGILEGNLKNLFLNQISDFVNIKLSGSCDSSFNAEYDISDLNKSIYSVKANLKNTEVLNFNSKNVNINILGQGSDWKIIDPTIELKEDGFINGKGFIASSVLDLSIDAQNVRLSSIGLDKKIVSGILNGKASGKGSIKSPIASGAIWISNFVLMDMPFNSIKAELGLKDNVLNVSPIVIKPIDGSFLDGEFSISILNSELLNARLNFQQLCLDLLKPFFPEEIKSQETDGIFNGYATYSNHKGINYWKVLVEGQDILFGGQDFDSVYLEADSFKNQAELKSLFVKAFGGKANLTGQIINKKKFAGSIEAENLKFNRMEFLKKYLPNLEGCVDFQGDIDWDGSNRKGNFTVLAHDLKINQRELGNFGGEMLLDSEKLSITNGEFDNLGINICGGILWKDNEPYNLELKLKNVDFSFIPQAHGITVFENGSILVDGGCTIKGSLASLTPDLIDLNLSKIKVQKNDDVIIANKPVKIVYDKGKLDIESLELKYKLGILSLNGSISRDNEVSIVIDGDTFSAKALGNLMGVKGIDFDGDVFLDCKIFGNLDNVNYICKSEIKNLNVEKRDIPLINLSFAGDSKQLKINETFVKLINSSFDLTGIIDLDNFLPIKQNIILSIPESQITDMVTYFPKTFKTADGSIKGKLNINGSFKKPEITGDLQLIGKKIFLNNMKKPLTDVVFDMTTDDMITTINTLRAYIGKGCIEGYGSIDFKNALGALDLHIKGEKLELPLLTLDISNASMTIDVGGDIYNPEINGYAFIPRGKLGLTTALIPESSNSKPFFNSMKYKVVIDIPRNFWVKNPFLNAEMKGKCSITGDLENFKIEGGIKTIQGKIFFKQRQFKIQNGEVKFGGVDNSLDPYIFVKSEGQVQSTKIFLTLQGNVSNFKPKVYSSPPMSEGDIIAMLTFGRDLNAVSNSNTKDLFEDEVLEGLKNSYISALIGDSISSVLNLDELYLTSAFDKTTGKSQSFVRIGKYISDKIFMAYEGTMSDDKDESYIFEYRLPKGFIFSVEFEQPKNNQNYGVRYDWQF